LSSDKAISQRSVEVSMPRIFNDLDTFEGSKLHSSLSFWTEITHGCGPGAPGCRLSCPAWRYRQQGTIL
jgi:hypothetical protein